LLCGVHQRKRSAEAEKKRQVFHRKKLWVLLWVDLGTVDDLVFLSSQNGPREIGG
jgi:hypothetical protein